MHEQAKTQYHWNEGGGMKTIIGHSIFRAFCAINILVFVMTAQAASFNCAKASAKVEHIICDNAEISKLDEELNAAYKGVLQDGQQADTVKQSQKQWMKERNGCADANCVEMAYRSRIDELKSTKTKDRFIPILSKDKSLCDAYKRYVEHEVATSDQYIHYASPMCQRNFGEKFPEFTSVKWREISPEDHPELAVQAYRYVNNSLPWSPPWANSKLSSKQFRDTLEGIKLNYANNWWHMWLGEADIGNDGHFESLLRVEDGRCGEESMTGHPQIWKVPVMVIDSKNKSIINKSEWILGVSVISESKDFQYEGMHSISLSSFDVFSFSRETYFDQWVNEWALPNSQIADPRYSKLTVYTVSKGKTETVCSFKFKKQGQ